MTSEYSEISPVVKRHMEKCKAFCLKHYMTNSFTLLMAFHMLSLLSERCASRSHTI
ncbi:hypothetical protein M5D96_001932 [Drosophila gunungcola]|uniref:Uncharacterized protein n=1 Tax=Drosophila gunungcola TaxID=103775 RepID=A0A9P9YZJ3_9MUSC|nr:hypothetical protein M5D96_001932 [Drosophila gunungcola]